MTEPYLFSVDQYRQMIHERIIGEEDDLELLEGRLVRKLKCSPRNCTSLNLLNRELERCLPNRWHSRIKCGLTLPDSETEPSVAVVRGDMREYCLRHPNAKDAGLIVEVSEDMPEVNGVVKARIYARAGIPVYWIVNLVNCRIEVYRKPSGAARKPAYRETTHFKVGEKVPFELDGEVVASIPVDKMIVV